MVVPLFFVAFQLKLKRTILPVIVAHLTFVLPVVTWFLIIFFDAVPKELEEAAMIDGAVVHGFSENCLASSSTRYGGTRAFLALSCRGTICFMR